MAKYNKILALLVLLPLALAPAACGDDADDRTALADEELERELDMALGRDSVMTTFEDTAAVEGDVAGEPDVPPAAERPAPREPERAQPERAQPERVQPERAQPERARPPVAQPAPEPRRVARSVPTGTTFAVRLNETLSTETNQVGDGFTATVDDPIVAADGTVLIPAGATVRGRVTGVKKSGRVGETAVLNLAFEAISFGGQSHPLSASVESADTERRTRTSTAETAGKVAAGAAAGAILGQVLGKDTKSTLKGAAIGAAAGTAIAMGTADVDAVLPAGSRMVVRLDEPVEVTV